MLGVWHFVILAISKLKGKYRGEGGGGGGAWTPENGCMEIGTTQIAKCQMDGRITQKGSYIIFLDLKNIYIRHFGRPEAHPPYIARRFFLHCA